MLTLVAIVTLVTVASIAVARRGRHELREAVAKAVGDEIERKALAVQYAAQRESDELFIGLISGGALADAYRDDKANINRADECVAQMVNDFLGLESHLEEYEAFGRQLVVDGVAQRDANGEFAVVPGPPPELLAELDGNLAELNDQISMRREVIGNMRTYLADITGVEVDVLITELKHGRLHMVASPKIPDTTNEDDLRYAAVMPTLLTSDTDLAGDYQNTLTSSLRIKRLVNEESRAGAIRGAVGRAASKGAAGVRKVVRRGGSGRGGTPARRTTASGQPQTPGTGQPNPRNSGGNTGGNGRST